MIAAVTNFYNPANRSNKWSNFKKFRESLKGIPLFIIEAAFENDPFVLPKSECFMQVRCKDVIWQQYRLVNLIIQSLPEKYDKVVWIDADIIFNEKDWAHKMSDLLSQYKIVQSFESVNLLSRDGSLDENKLSVVHKAYLNSKKPEVSKISSCLNMATAYATGFSWGIQREVIEKFGVYDYWVTGSADNSFVLGIYGDWNNSFIHDRLNQKMKDHFMEWAVPFHEYIGGNVYYLDTTINHLWHGHRNYKKRWNCLKDFNPYEDIKIDENGVFVWSSKKTDMHRCCRKMCYNYDREFKTFL